MSYAKIVLVPLGLGIAVASAGRYALGLVGGSEARRWPTAEGRVISSGVDEIRSRVTIRGRTLTPVTRYRPRIAYRYIVDGKPRTGSRIWFGDLPTWDSRRGAERFAADYPLFAPVRVHYDPDDPEEAFLVAGSPSIGWPILAGFGLLLAWLGRHPKGRPAPAAADDPHILLRQAVGELEAHARGALPRDHYVVNVPPTRKADGSLSMGYPAYQAGMERLWTALFRGGVDTVTPEAYDGWLARDPAPLETPGQVAAIGDRNELLLRLFTLRRAERFCDGYWTIQLEKGLLLAYARRLMEMNAPAGETRRRAVSFLSSSWRRS